MKLVRETGTVETGTNESETLKALDEIRARLGVVASTKRPLLFQMDAVELLAKKFDAPRWLVHGLITRGGVAIIGGEAKASLLVRNDPRLLARNDPARA